MNQILNEASKMFEKLTIHLNECEDYNCCVRQIANELLLGDKDNYVSCEPVTAKDNPEILRKSKRSVSLNYITLTFKHIGGSIQ